MSSETLLASILVGLSATIFIAPTVAAAPPSYDPKPWLEDLEQTREALSTKYANLEWVVIEREIDLASVFTDAKAQLQSAASDSDARAAFEELATHLGDGHVRFRWSSNQSSTQPPNANCEALGYDGRIRGGVTAAFVPGYLPLADASGNEFPAGTVQVIGHRVGVIKIGIFTPKGMPELCSQSLVALKISPNTVCDEACKDRIETWVSERLTRDLDAQIRAIENAKADVLLIDVANNGGGTQWAEAAARMVTAIRLKSERVGFVRGPHWAKHFADTAADLRADAKGASQKDGEMLNELAEQVQGYQHEAETPCDSQPLWQGKRPSCSWLGQGIYASGIIASADPKAIQSKPWAKDIFTPAQYPYKEGVWRGPLIVLVNEGTGSAAEQFAAVLQDNHAAVIMGAPTVGAGCGHTNGGTPTTLKNSGGILELPDCARIRADGSNEVMGVQPDVLVGLRSTDGPHRQGIRIAEKLPEAVARAIRAGDWSVHHP
jgi:Peptidase family S41